MKYTPKDLRKEQWRVIRFALPLKGFLLLMDMGLGKTIAILSIIKALMHAGKLEKPVLIVAPIRVLYTVWAQEALQWSHTRKLTFSLVHGSVQQRMHALRVPADVYLISAHGMVWLLKLLKNKKALAKWPFGMLVIDESSAFSAAGTKRFRTLRHYLHLFEYRIPMSGTPRPNSLLQIWAQVFIADLGERLGTSYNRFKDRFFRLDHPKGFKYVPRPGAERYIMHAISDITLSITLPPKYKTLYNPVWVELPPRVRAQYDELEEEMFLELETGSVEAINAAVLSSKCWQIANGAIYTEDEFGTKDWEPLHTEKLEALDEIINETGSPVLVAYHFKHDLLRLQAAYPGTPVLGDMKTLNRTVNAWNAGKLPMLFAHYKSAGHGLNLQFSGGHTIACFSLTWSREMFDQLINRMGGARAQRAIMVHMIMARNTVDEAIRESNLVKGRGQAAFRMGLEALQEYKRRRQHGR